MASEESKFEKDLTSRIAGELWKAPATPDYGPLRPVSELKPDEIASELWRRHLIWDYDQYGEYFDRWWDSLYKSMQVSLDALCEDFRDYSEWLRSAMPIEAARTLADSRLVPVLKVEYSKFLERLPTISYEEFAGALQDRRAALDLKARFAEAEKYISKTFGLKKQRPIENADRDRMFSKWSYWGLSESQIQGQAAYGESTIRKAITAHRRRTRNLRWALRISIYVTEMPPIRKPEISRQLIP